MNPLKRRYLSAFGALGALLLFAPVSWSGVTLQSAQQFAASSEDPPVDHPNEPVGAVMVTDRPFVALDEDGWDDSDGTGDPHATLSMSGGVMTALFPTGYPSTGSSSRCTTSNYSNWSGVEAVYIHIQIRYSANWWGQDGSGVNKILYIGDEATNPIVLDAHGAGASTLRLRVATQGGETVNFDWDDASDGTPNGVVATAADAEIARGEWVDIELLIEPNTPGLSNGTINAWVNNVKTQQYSGRPIYVGGTNLANQRWHVHPIYGGGGGTPVPADQTLEYRMLYLSTVN